MSAYKRLFRVFFSALYSALSKIIIVIIAQQCMVLLYFMHPICTEARGMLHFNHTRYKYEERCEYKDRGTIEIKSEKSFFSLSQDIKIGKIDFLLHCDLLHQCKMISLQLFRKINRLTNAVSATNPCNQYELLLLLLLSYHT